MCLKCGLKIYSRIDQTDWKGDNIVIMGKTTICPPYLSDNIKGVPDSKAFQHIRKIVSRKAAIFAQGLTYIPNAMVFRWRSSTATR